MRTFPAAVALISAVSCSLFTGCSGSPAFPMMEASATSSSPDTPVTASSVLKGHIHGGQQPIAGAKIYLLAAGTTGYGSAAKSLLTSASYPGYTSQQDSKGNYYVLTDSGGNFQIADQCSPGQQVYVASVGGNPGSGNNSAATEIAILGGCPAGNNFDSTLTNVFISEISTVVAAYAVSAYATDVFDIGGPSTTTIEQTGIANAFANAANLFDVQNLNDTALTMTPVGKGTVPQAKIHTIANILSSCVNSTGPSSSACSILFSGAKTGGTTGTAPTDVTTAAINIAHNPWASVSTLLPLQTAVTPFSPQLPASGANAPADFTIAVDYSGAALGSNPSLAVDASGDVWSLVPGQTSVAKLSPLGVVLSGATGYSIGSGVSVPRALAIDTNNDVWVLGQTTFGSSPTAGFAHLSNVGVPYTPVVQPATTLFINPLELGVSFPSATTNLVLDGAGNFLYSSQYALQVFGATINIGNCCTVKYNMANGTVTNLDTGNMTPGTGFVATNGTTVWDASAGNSLSWASGTSKSVTGGGLNKAVGLALDKAGNAWVANSGGSTVSAFSSTGTAISTTSGFSGGLSTPKAIAVDGLGGVWVTNTLGSYILTPFTNAGAVIGSGYLDANLSGAGSVVIDASGNIWVASSATNTISQFIGVAAPVVTPMAAAVSGGLVGQRP